MKYFIMLVVLWIVMLPELALAACSTQTIMYPDGTTVLCTTCCFGSHCTTTCM